MEPNMELSLDPIERPQSTKESSLSEKIVRITQERGSFSNITEEALTAEIEAGAGTPPQDEASPEEVHEFEQNRAVLSAKIRSALNESALSLDFVSLLVSCLRPQAGASSMSPMLKGQVPIGTLSGDTISPQSVMPTLSEVRGDPGYGWKLMALEDAATKLDKAVERLEQEASKEERFWKDAWKTMSQGEKLFKQKRRLRIKYGYKDSGSQYFMPGQGSVDRSEDGSLLFSADTKPSEKVLCVTVHKNDQVAGRAFALPDPAASEIARARHYLYEDELFYYLVQEARTLAGSRVSLTGNSIVCQLYENVVEISSIPVASLESEDNVGVLANVLCNTLHLLLNARHAENLRRSRAPPPPLNSAKPKLHTDQLPLLRPALAHIQQATTEQRARKLVEMMLPGAKITEVPGTPPSTPLETLLECPPTVYEIEAESSFIRLTVNPPYGTKSMFEAEANDIHSHFRDLAELELWLRGENQS